MASFAFWNTYRLGGGSGENKRIIIEGVLAQIFNDYPDCAFAVLCEVTSDVKLGDAQVGKGLYTASKKKGQLAYSGFDYAMDTLDLERADIEDFRDVFGNSPNKKGGGKFSKQSKRPVCNAGQCGNTAVYIYHANSSNKAAFLVAWVAEALNQETAGNFVLAGDFNCDPTGFCTQIDLATGNNGYHQFFGVRHDYATHNAKHGLVSTYDWAIEGHTCPKVTVKKIDFNAVINNMGFTDDPRSDHLPIVVTL